MTQNKAWAMKMIEKELKIRNCLKNILIMDHIDTFDLMRVERAAEPISFNNFGVFCPFSIISIAKDSFWGILSHFRPKIATFRATDASFLQICHHETAA